MIPSEKRKKIAMEDKKNLYSPMYKLMGRIIKRLEKLELNIPIYKLAWKEVRGDFSAKRHKKFRSEILKFLKVTNEYRKIYWNIVKLSRRKFEVEMIKDGSYAPDIREYESLKNEIPNVILKGYDKVWIESYNSYLPKIRERSLKKKKKPRSGKQMHKAIKTDLKDVLGTLKSQQKESIEFALKFRKCLELMKGQPHKTWGFWTEADLKKVGVKSEVKKIDKKINKTKKDTVKSRKSTKTKKAVEN